jgi:hypothetical protein
MNGGEPVTTGPPAGPENHLPLRQLPRGVRRFTQVCDSDRPSLRLRFVGRSVLSPGQPERHLIALLFTKAPLVSFLALTSFFSQLSVASSAAHRRPGRSCDAATLVLVIRHGKLGRRDSPCVPCVLIRSLPRLASLSVTGGPPDYRCPIIPGKSFLAIGRVGVKTTKGRANPRSPLPTIQPSAGCP